MLWVIITYRLKRAEHIWNYYFRNAAKEVMQLSQFWVAQMNLMCKPLMEQTHEAVETERWLGAMWKNLEGTTFMAE